MVADPPIKAFMPQVIYTEDSQVTTEDLHQSIVNVEVSDAVLIYNLLKKNNVEVGEELKQSLLELLCFYNMEDTLSEELIEERWFRQGTRGKERQRKTWKDSDLAEQIFNEIENKTAKTYSALIRGMGKFNQVERTWALYQECIEKKLEIDVNTYNSVIKIISFLREGADLRIDLLNNILTDMKNQKIMPNLGTFNATLETVSSVGNNKLARNYTLKTLSEFKMLGIEPSLATWYFVLVIFCRERGPVSHVLIDIMNQIENKSFKIQDPKDTFFFVTAMDICRNHVFDKNLAKRVDKLLHFGDNYNLIGDSYKESIYYRHYFALLCATEPLETFMAAYNLLVPNIYIPEPGVMEELLKAINENGAIQYVSQMWSHLVIFDHVSRENLLALLLKTMIEHGSTEDVELNKQFSDIAWGIWSKIEEQNETRRQQVSWQGHMLSEILLLCCRAGEFERADTIFTKIDKDQHKILGEPKIDSLKAFIELCVQKKSPTKAINCLQYSVECGFTESKEFAQKIVDSFTLDETKLSKIKSLVGNDVVRKAN